MICLLCQESNKDSIKLTSHEGKGHNISSLLFKYFRFCFDIEPNDGDLCRNCWRSLISFHEFYVRIEAVKEQINKNGITSYALDQTIIKEEIVEDDFENSQSTFRSETIIPESFNSDLSQVFVTEHDDQTDGIGVQCEQMKLYSCRDAVNDILPDKSQKRYITTYDGFVKWQKKSEGEVSFAERVLLDYFEEMSKKYKPSSLWSMYSMLKSTILCHHNINISKYSRLLTFLKIKADGFQSKKAKLFTDEEMTRFLREAPDDQFLAMKTVLVLAVIGASRGEEATNFKISYIQDNSNEIIMRIPDTKNKNSKTSKAYIIDGHFAEIVRKYMKLRPKNAPTDRFFMQYLNGKCTAQVMGKHKIANIPKEIAKYLQLSDWRDYTGHSFRGFDETKFLAGSGALDTLQKRKIDKVIEPVINLPSTITSARNTSEPSLEVNVTSNRNALLPTQYYENISHSEISIAVKEEPIDESFETIDDSPITIDENCTELSDSDLCDTFEICNDVLDDNLQDKSQKRYVGAYGAFTKWQKSNGTDSFAEPVLLTYFKELSNTYKPSSLWSVFSMLRCTILSNQNINMSEYTLLTEFLKKKSVGFQSKKTKAFTTEEVKTFLLDAPDDRYLAMKTVVVLGVTGAWNVREMTNFKTSYIQDNIYDIIIRTPNTKTHDAKVYIIDGQLAEIVRKYMKLRPENSPTDRFFMRYVDGKCTLQMIGKHKIASMPKEIAKYLQLPDWQEYTGHSFRGFNGTTILGNCGSDNVTRKRYSHKRKSGNVIGPAQKLPTISSNEKPDTIPPLVYFAPKVATASMSNAVPSSQYYENDSSSDLNVTVKEENFDGSFTTIKEETIDEYFTITDESFTTTTVSMSQENPSQIDSDSKHSFVSYSN